MSAKRWKKQFTGVDSLDFSPGLLRIQTQPHTGEPVKIKLAAYQFQKYGMVEGRVAHLSADASDNNQQQANKPTTKPAATCRSPTAP